MAEINNTYTNGIEFSDKYNMVANFTNYALSLAEGISVNGGETKDIEDAVSDVCKAYGAKYVNVWAIPSLIEVTVTMSDGFRLSLSRRIYHDEINLYRLERFDKLIETIVKETPDEQARNEMLQVVQTSNPYGQSVYILSGVVAASSWCLYFGGAMQDAVLAGIIGLIFRYCEKFISNNFNDLTRTLLLAAISGVIASAMNMWGLTINYASVVIGVIMLQIPTLLVANGIRDLFGEDIVCGILKISQALLTTMAIAIGYTIAMYMFKTTFTEAGYASSNVVMIVSAVIGTLAFALIFKVSLKNLPYAVLGGLISSTLWVIFQGIFQSDFYTAFMVTIIITIYALLMNRYVTNSNTNTFLIPGIISLLPGNRLYYSIGYLVEQNTTQFSNQASLCIQMVLGITFGIVGVTLTYNFLVNYFKKVKIAKAAYKDAKKPLK